MATCQDMSEERFDASDLSTLEAGGTRTGTRTGTAFGIHNYGESGHHGIHFQHFVRTCFNHSAPCRYFNILWVVVPAAIVIGFVKRHDESGSWHLAIFILNYVAMVPAANLIGFGGEQIVRKVYNVVGLIIETTLGSIVEMVVFTILITRTATDTFDPIQIIQAAILGSVLANLLFCIGLCFFIGGMKREEQQFHAAIGEVGGGLILVAGMALILPSAYINTLQDTEYGGTGDFDVDGLKISRGTAFILLASYMVYLWYQTNSHRSLYSDVFNHDLLVGDNHDKAVEEEKLSLSECLLALVISITCVCCIAYLLVDQIHFIVEERHVKDAFVGLILVPVIEKAAEHLTAVGDASDNRMNFALFHVIGSCIQTVMLITPIIIFIGWGVGKDMTLAFEPFQAIVLILAILVVGGFLRDGKSDYLRGFLCLVAYLIIAVCSYYYPNPTKESAHFSTLVLNPT
ncbi:vacuolar h+\ ca2+ exchanger [Diplodia corticola]|uniref:Vacuolar h+\ ca2+ exchanger n=1 Tax=Diplodia corticola TaxID=236234 RepID=A0A1J9RYP3_9PEZI|nr:vacuolar h+\ ca2+ exchanger [Diplodia corticola]OJD32565.1 vacuolar h+\ ca2+ exchanger [Diplodia corticola]